MACRTLVELSIGKYVKTVIAFITTYQTMYSILMKWKDKPIPSIYTLDL